MLRLHWKKSRTIETASVLLYVVVASSFMVLHYVHFEGMTAFVARTVFSSFMIYFMLVDLREWRVPMLPALSALAFGLASSFFQADPTLMHRLIGSVGGMMVMWSLLVLTTYMLRLAKVLKNDEFSLGSGDVLIVGVIGAFVGYLDLPRIIIVGCLQALIAFVLGKFLPILALKSPWPIALSSYPLGAFLCLSALLYLVSR